MRDDESLVAAARAGETAAFAELVVRNRARVLAVVDRMVGNRAEAEDLVQEALLRAYLGLSQLRDPARFGSWLCGIAVNLARMRIRRRKLEVQHLRTRTAVQGGEEHAMLDLVREAVEVLPSGQREAVLLRYVDGLSCDEIAALLGTSSGAVRVRLHRARAQLRADLAVLAPRPGPTAKERTMIEMRLEDVFVRVAETDPATLVAPQRIVVLREVQGERRLCIWVGAAEGDALALHLTNEATPRPLTVDLMAELVRLVGGRVEQVAITTLRERTFYAVVVLAIDGRTEELDARPSDALNLAVRAGAPILVVEAVLEENALAEGDLRARLDHETTIAGAELPPGEWSSLSGELLRSLYPAP